ncbi:MAG: TolC family protein [Planctomycetes bacterium]|nr:TolC family protein [Planctomycetota bacterium]
MNLPAALLTYSPADEKRDVTERLRRYALAEGLTIENAEHAAEALLAPNPQITTLGIRDAFRTAQASGREYRNAEDDFVISAIRLLIERHLWGPRLFNDTTLGIVGNGVGGRFDHTLDVVNKLKATQQLPYGGSLEAAWIVRATDQLRESATQGYNSSSSLALSGNIPLLRGAGLVAQEDLIQAERNLIYAARDFERFRRDFLVSIASDYFGLLQDRALIANQLRQIWSLQELERSTDAKVKAGRVEEFELGIASNRVQSARSSLLSLIDRYIFAIERFKIRLGLPLDQAIAISDEMIDLPDPEVDQTRAAELALQYRLDLQNRRDALDDYRRGVANARNGLLPDLNLAGTVTMPTASGDATGGLAIQPDEVNYAASATLSLPLDRRIERLNLRTAMINLERQSRDYAVARDNVVAQVRDSLRAVDTARLQLRLAEEQVKINRRRLVGLELQKDTIDAQTRVDAENDLLVSENDRDRSITSLRNAVLNYLLASDQLRVTNDGDFQPLPGMPGAASTPAPAAPEEPKP